MAPQDEERNCIIRLTPYELGGLRATVRHALDRYEKSMQRIVDQLSDEERTDYRKYGDQLRTILKAIDPA